LSALFRKTSVLCGAMFALLGFVPGAPADTPGEVRIGEPLRNAMLQGLNGRTRRLSEFHGRPLLINVWASWCGPCRSEMASLERLAWLEPAKHFTIIGISTDDDRDKALAYLNHSNATISHFIDYRLQMENMLGAERLPLTVLVDSKGRVIDKIYGARQWDGPEALALIGSAFGIGAAADATATLPSRPDRK
jgi:thiol-disulfide isomerase/thioredoxin